MRLTVRLTVRGISLRVRDNETDSETHSERYLRERCLSLPPKNREIALGPNTRVVNCKFMFHTRQTSTIMGAIGTDAFYIVIQRDST